ncbi:uncharacterized protein TOT_040000647 [Theileria orientalis strain Shintoku]|uniref:Thioredoxin domain-containing protein n=1 Tax=Theileria orientalis strain Shintoku TaxID=869250 RepID=J4C9C1_THEOR|nr:uncharacterized protein TOT_040000647 [Theileria orientalis strain Shintoku]PVC53909.1 hypothetical protein MACL_00003423 [Theileria orientalis]BAM42278.1 uncharacterized protein TOT_040000647 [Theileria orientalis strain Shintoku]|eukprot:XP_009692579.1 uncharacterized protein TOT_040000647 [Theileria orientalis strain Shintoku]
MFISYYNLIFTLLVFNFPVDVYSHTFYKDSSLKSDHSLQSVHYNGSVIGELSTFELQKLFDTIPPLDHVVLFYINLNSDCRNFFPLYSQLYRDLYSEGYKIKFVKFNCQGLDKRIKICQKYNINVVPTLVYVSSYRIQRNNIPRTSFVRRFLRYLFFDKNSDVNLANATRFVRALNFSLRYKGEIFAYDQLHDWVSLMYNLSTFNRRFGTRRDFVNSLRSLWNEFISIFKR